MTAQLWTDGGSRGNPGLAAGGIVLKNGALTLERGWFLGTHLTNNEAEYRAFILGLRLARIHKIDVLEVRLDSKLVVKQVLGDWACRSDNLRPWLKQARSAVREFEFITIEHIPRAQNKQADRLANQAMDQFTP